MSRGRARFQTTLAFLAALGALAPPAPTASQVVQGHVLEVGTGAGVASGWVMLLDTTFAVRASAVTNRDGLFQLQAPEPGAYYVLTEVLGYEPIIDGILELGAGGSISVDLFIKPRPVQMDSLVVAVERAQIFQHLEKSGFNQRMSNGFGAFITPEEIRRRNPAYYSELFRNIPGVDLEGGGSLMGTQIRLSNASIRGSTCNPPVYVDGSQVSTEFGGLEAAVDIRQIAAVEVYTRASNVPAQWGGTNAGCGVVLIWTR